MHARNFGIQTILGCFHSNAINSLLGATAAKSESEATETPCLLNIADIMVIYLRLFCCRLLNKKAVPSETAI